jgi:hypothetical protein
MYKELVCHCGHLCVCVVPMFLCTHMYVLNNCSVPGIGRRIILKWILEKWDGGHGLDQSG